jgi:hypothetical protein
MAAGLFILAMLGADADADHFEIWAENPVVNPLGLATPTVELRGVNKYWITQEIPYCLTTDWDTLPAEVSQAVADWEIILPGEGLTTRPEFEPQCEGSSQVPFGIRLRSKFGDEPGCISEGFVACTLLPDTDFGADYAQVGGSYSYSDSSLDPHNQARIWINDSQVVPTGMYFARADCS